MHLSVICGLNLIVGAAAERRILNAGRHAERLAGGPDCARHKLALAGVRRHVGRSALLRQLGRLKVNHIHLRKNKDVSCEPYGVEKHFNAAAQSN